MLFRSEERPLTPQERAAAIEFKKQLQNFIATSKAEGTFKDGPLREIFKKAIKSGVAPQTLHQAVAAVVKEFPNSAHHILHAVVLAHGPVVHPQVVTDFAKTVVVSHPKPYSMIEPIVAQLEILKSCVNCGDLDPEHVGLQLAQIAPDNPLTSVAATRTPGTPSVTTTSTSSEGPGAFDSRIPLKNPQDPEFIVTPVSPAAGEEPAPEEPLFEEL